MITLAVHGAAGRMGQRLVELGEADGRFELVAAVEHAAHAGLGKPVCAAVSRLALTDGLPARADVLIDFSLPAGTRRAIELCREHRMALVIGTTGLGAADHKLIDSAAGDVPVLQAPNMSMGVNVLFALANKAAALLGEGYDIEIEETHHRHKKDAPSGTALGILDAVCKARGVEPGKAIAFGQYGPNAADAPRQPGQIGVHCSRMGDVVGDHTVRFGTAGERVELRHIATSRDIFTRGALDAAAWLAGQPAGRYTMPDVLGL